MYTDETEQRIKNYVSKLKYSLVRICLKVRICFFELIVGHFRSNFVPLVRTERKIASVVPNF
jgi:hypothetical protein